MAQFSCFLAFKGNYKTTTNGQTVILCLLHFPAQSFAPRRSKFLNLGIY